MKAARLPAPYIFLLGLLCPALLAQPTTNQTSNIRFGIMLIKTNGNLAIGAVIGKVAYDAGLRRRQIIKQIDGHSTADMTVEQGAEALKGPAGSKVDLDIIKVGQTNPEHIQLTRSPFVLLTQVVDRIIEPNIGVLTIRSLELDGGDKVRKALENFKTKHVKAVILDFRDNGGGYIKGATDVANLFLDKKCVLWITKRDREYIENSTPANVWSGPVVILVNGATASGAELITSVLRLNRRAKVAGERTAGSASIRSGSPSVKIGRYLNAKHEEIDGHGIQPDVLIDMNASDESVIARAAAILQ